jgi:hypothetical protein
VDISLILAISGIAIGVASLAFVFFQKVRIDRVLKTGGKSLENSFKDLEKKFKQSNVKLSELEKLVEEYIGLSRLSVQKVGFRKYDAYDDTGGQQSFVLILLDRNDNGVVINSMHGRDMTRVYGKKIVHGNSEVSLAEEESAVLKELISTK